MNPVVILALISDLYDQLATTRSSEQQLKERVADLEAKLNSQDKAS